MNILLLGNKTIQYVVAAIAFIIILVSCNSKMFAQDSIANWDKLKLFEGEWKLKDNVWKSITDSTYKEDVNSNWSFIAKAVSPANTVLWNVDFGNGAWAILLWTYHNETGRINHISNTSDNNVGVGEGQFDQNNDLKIKIVYPNGCISCHRIYTYHWINKNEIDFKATIYNDDKLTGDFYGGTLIRTVSSLEDENSVKFVEIGVNVHDTIRSLAFYQKIFGMKRAGDWHASKEMAAAAGVNNGRAFDIVNLNLQCDGYLLNYKLNQSESNIDRAAGSAPPGYDFEELGASYFTINVENVDPYIEKIEENNINYKLVALPNGLRVIMLHDPDGVLLEILGK